MGLVPVHRLPHCGILSLVKILFVVHTFLPNVGGSEYYVYHMAKEMQCRGHDVTVLAHNLNTYYEGRLTK